MEGREPPADAGNEDPPAQPSRRSSAETYVIQIPKDQIYRVPPPENALIAERFRNPETSKGRKSPCLPRLLCMGILLLVMALIIGITFSALYFALSPVAPTFSIMHVVVVVINPKSSSGHNDKKHNPHTTSYEISLKANNVNSRTGIYYQNGGTATLSFWGKSVVVGKGEFPTLHQDENDITTVRLVIDGSNRGAALSGQETNKPGQPVSLALKMELPTTMNLGFANIWNKDILIDCKFKVSALTDKGSRIISQECQSQFEP